MHLLFSRNRPPFLLLYPIAFLFCTYYFWLGLELFSPIVVGISIYTQTYVREHIHGSPVFLQNSTVPMRLAYDPMFPLLLLFSGRPTSPYSLRWHMRI